MADSMMMQHREEDRRLLMKLQHRLLRTPEMEEIPIAPMQNDAYLLIFALAPMAMAFLYLTIFSFVVLR